MSDIVKQLREWDYGKRNACSSLEIMVKAADEIERLKEDLHYNKGCCDLAMKHRDEAETQVEALRIQLKTAEGEVTKWKECWDIATDAQQRLNRINETLRAQLKTAEEALELIFANPEDTIDSWRIAKHTLATIREKKNE